MAEMTDCMGKPIKVGKTSITIKREDGKTSGLVLDIKTLNNMPLNMAFDYLRLFRQWGVYGNMAFNTKCIIVKNEKIYALRNIKIDLFREKYGYFSDYEKQKAEERENVYNILKDHGVEIIEAEIIS